MAGLGRAVVASVFFFAAGSASAAEWQKLADWSDGAGGLMAVYIDTESQREYAANQYHGVIKQFWVKRVHKDGKTDIAQYDLSCVERTYSILSAHTYNSEGGLSQTYPTEMSRPIEPDSLVDTYRVRLCP
jgi:hypothetical protein